MKLTKRQILKIIREEAIGVNVASAFSFISDREDEEEAVLDPEVDEETVKDAWAGGENLVDPIDQSDAAGGEPVTAYVEIEEIVERIGRKLRIKKLIREMDWVDPMAFLPDAESVEQAWAQGDRLSIMIDQPGVVGEVEPDDDEELDELEESVARAFGLSLKKRLTEQEQKPAEGEEPPAEGEAPSEGEAQEEAPPEGEAQEDPTTQAGKKAAVALDKSAAQPLVSAIDSAGNLAGVEEILSQLIQQMSDDGKGFVKKAMQNLVREA